MSTTRRQFITGSVALGAAALLSSCGSNASKEDPGNTLAHPWPYKQLDAVAAAQRGYDIYWERHCMAGPFQAIVANLGEQLGEPYSSFPFEMLTAGSGGLKVGSVCGTCNGSALAIALFVADGADCSAMINDLFNWYEQTALPVYVPANPHEDIAVTPTKALSNLCHSSVTRWSNAEGLSPSSPEKKERCARLTADVTQKLVEMLNAYFAGTWAASSPLSSDTATCRGCHDSGGMVNNTKAKMECTSCHDEHAL